MLPIQLADLSLVKSLKMPFCPVEGDEVPIAPVCASGLSVFFDELPKGLRLASAVKFGNPGSAGVIEAFEAVELEGVAVVCCGLEEMPVKANRRC